MKGNDKKISIVWDQHAQYDGDLERDIPVVPVFTGIFFDFDEEDRRELLSQFIRPLEDTHLHHLTLKFRPTWEDVRNMVMGRSVWLTVTGQCNYGDVQAFVVDRDSIPYKCNNDIPHITAATKPGVQVFKANEALARGYQFLDDRFFLLGRVGVYLSDGTIEGVDSGLEPSADHKNQMALPLDEVQS